jgi:hypothetical protein
LCEMRLNAGQVEAPLKFRAVDRRSRTCKLLLAATLTEGLHSNPRGERR